MHLVFLVPFLYHITCVFYTRQAVKSKYWLLLADDLTVVACRPVDGIAYCEPEGSAQISEHLLPPLPSLPLKLRTEFKFY